MNVTIYMKSGNKITADKVKDWAIKYNSEQITSLRIDQDKKCKSKVLVGSIDLKQIEEITEH